jgi:dipeptidyl aminopeptidase/acylaminoacyl peptidase
MGAKMRPVARSSDGSGEALPLFDEAESVIVDDWTADDRLWFTVLGPEKSDIWYRSIEGKTLGELRPFLQDKANEAVPDVSPDGRYVAYVAEYSGRPEIYIEPFPERGRRTLVSTSGGEEPRWSRDGSELFYSQAQTLMRVEVEAATGGSLFVGAPTPLFDYLPAPDWVPNYDVSPDGQLFMVHTTFGDGQPGSAPKIRVVENWYEEFRDRAQD